MMSASRSKAGILIAAVVLLGPVIQPWYLLWFLPLFAATGLSVRELKGAVLLTAAFTIHGMIESSANADNLTDIGDSITFVVSIIVVVLIDLNGANDDDINVAVGVGLSSGERSEGDHADGWMGEVSRQSAHLVDDGLVGAGECEPRP